MEISINALKGKNFLCLINLAAAFSANSANVNFIFCSPRDVANILCFKKSEIVHRLTHSHPETLFNNVIILAAEMSSAADNCSLIGQACHAHIPHMTSSVVGQWARPDYCDK